MVGAIDYDIFVPLADYRGVKGNESVRFPDLRSTHQGFTIM